MACDICGKTGTPLADLRPEHQTSGIKAICPDCVTIVNRKNSSLLGMLMKMKADLLVRFIRQRKEARNGE